MNRLEKIMLRLMIMLRHKFGYKLPQLKDARPIRTEWWAVYRHHGRLIRLIPMDEEEQEDVRRKQIELDTQYAREELLAMDPWISECVRRHGRTPDAAEREEWQLKYETENEKPEYRPCEKCVFSIYTPGDVLPCPEYNVVAGSAHHACCTHKYEIIKDIEK